MVFASECVRAADEQSFVGAEEKDVAVWQCNPCSLCYNQAILGRSFRLRKPQDLKQVFEHPQKIKLKSDVYILYMCANQYQRPRLGILVSKHNCVLAVQRNRIRRKIKACFLKHIKELGAVDIVVVYSPRMPAFKNTGAKESSSDTLSMLFADLVLAQDTLRR